MNGDHVDPHAPAAEDAQAGSHILPFPFQEKLLDGNRRWWLQFLKGVEPTAATTDLADGARTKPLRISYGWARAFYRDSLPLRGLSTPTGGSPLTASERTPLQFGGLYTDVVVPAGHRLAFKVSNAAGGTVASNLGGTVTLFTGEDGSRVLLPVVE